MTHPVLLVGAGPGDPGLLTLRGDWALQRADVVIADRLAPRELLEGLRPEVEVIVRGDGPGDRHGALGQQQINELLIEKARQGKRVVRLKGGDPFVFGRGGEEAEALLAAGLSFEVVPGITAAIAAPAYAGIPVTHRHVAGAVAFVTGHEAERKDGGLVDWTALANGATTLVLYMSVTHLPGVTRRLLDAGRDPSTPAAVIERGTTPRQRTIVGTLADIAERAQRANVEPPALTIVGDVVGLRGSLDWFERRPLRGRRLLAVSAIGDRDEDQANGGPLLDATESLRALGLHVEWSHPLRIVERPERLQHALTHLSRFRWIAFTSHRAVLAFGAALDAAGLDGRALAGIKIASLDGRTAKAVRGRLRLRPDLTAEGGGRALAEALIAAGPVDGAVLFPRAAEGRDELPFTLAGAGVEVELIDAYGAIVDEAHVAHLVAAARTAPFDACVFASPRGAAALLDSGLDPGGAIVGAIGRTTATSLEARGLHVAVVASRPSFATLLTETAAALARASEKG